MENVEAQKVRKVKAVSVACCSRWLAVVNKWQSETSHSCFQCCTTAYKGTVISPPSCGHIKYRIRNTFAFLWWIIFHGILLVLECLFLRCVRRGILKSVCWIPQDSSGPFWWILDPVIPKVVLVCASARGEELLMGLEAAPRCLWLHVEDVLLLFWCTCKMCGFRGLLRIKNAVDDAHRCWGCW